MLLFVPIGADAQAGGDSKVSREGYGMVKTNLTTAHYSGWGNVKDGVQAKISYEMVSNKAFTLTANAQYSSAEVDFKASDLSKGYDPDLINLNGSHYMEQIGFTSTVRAKMFGKPFMGIVKADTEWDGKDFARVSGTVVGLFMLRTTKRTQFGIGPLAMINTSSSLPAFVMFLYRHRFNEKWLLNLYGGLLTCDYTPTQNDLISFGADVDVKSFYFSPNDSTLPKRSRFKYTSFRPMVKYRRRLAQNFYFDAQAGVALKISSRVNGVSGSKEYLKCRQKPTPFLQIGASYSL